MSCLRFTGMIALRLASSLWCSEMASSGSGCPPLRSSSAYRLMLGTIPTVEIVMWRAPTPSSPMIRRAAPMTAS